MTRVGIGVSGNASFDMSSTSNLTVSGGTVALQNANSSSGGDLKIASGGTKSITGGTFQIGNASTPTLQSFKINSAISIFNLTINSTNSPTGTLDTNSLATTGTVTVNSGGTLNCGTLNVTGSGAFTLSSGATLGIGSAAGITSSGATGNIQVTGTRTFSTGASYTYNGTSAQNTGTGLPASCDTFTDSNTGGTVTLQSDLTVVSGFSLPASANVKIDNAKTLTMTPNAVIGGTLSGGDANSTFLFKGTTLTHNGTISVAKTTVDNAGVVTQHITTSATAGTWTGTNLTFSGGGTKSLDTDMTFAVTTIQI